MDNQSSEVDDQAPLFAKTSTRAKASGCSETANSSKTSKISKAPELSGNSKS